MPEKKKNEIPVSAYKTETQLKEEAKERHRIEQLMMAQRKPKSPVEAKAENYWYHYRGLTLGGLFALALVIFFVRDVIFKTDPDITAIMVSSTFISVDHIDPLAKEIERHLADINGDGKIYALVDYIPYFPPGQEDETQPTVDDSGYIMKLMAVVAAGSDPIYILDKAAYEYLMQWGDDGSEFTVFLPLEGLIPGAEGDALPISATVLEVDEFAPYLKDDLAFYYFNIRETERNADYRAGCLDFLIGIAKK